MKSLSSRLLAGVFVCAAAGFCMPLASGLDLTGDGEADVLWRNQGAGGTGQNYLYPMDGTTILPGEGYLPTVANLNWNIVAVADFDADGKADILWRHAITGENYIYLMNGTSVASEGYIRTVADPAWQVAGTGDFDGNGTADILWRNSRTGQNYVYPMQGLTILGSEAYLPTVANLDWKVVAIARFDLDAMADILWRNVATGQNYIYRMSGTTVIEEGYIRTVSSQNWAVVGTGDFDGNGTADILWRNTSTGENYIYPMNGLTILPAEDYIRTVSNQNWRVVSVGRFNAADTRADILWRNAITGENYLYLMNGTAIIGEGYLRNVSDRDWIVQPAPPCQPTSPAGMNLSVTPSRTSGVAPLYVFFDASATTSAATTRPFHDVEYQWNFGDPGSGVWTKTPDMPNLSRNLATGPLAGHVFERPGTYDVCVSAFDGTRMGTARVRITVSDPDVVFAGTNTFCYSTSGNFAGCPLNATQRTVAAANFGTQLGTDHNANRRILLRRGETWTTTGNAALTRSGPGILGAYGDPALPRPIVRAAAGNVTQILRLSQDDLTIADWRIMDLEFDGAGLSVNGVEPQGGADQITYIRMNIHDVNTAFEYSGFVLEFNNNDGGPQLHIWDQMAVIDSNISNIDRYGGFVSAKRIAWLGNNVDTLNPIGSGHGLRFPYLYKGVITNSRFADPSGQHHVFTVRGPCNTGSGCSRLEVDFVDGGFSEHIVVTDNKFQGNSESAAYTISMEPTDTQSDERVRNAIIERNWFVAGTGTQYGLMLEAFEITVRNNVFVTTGGVEKKGILVRNFNNVPSFPDPTDIRIYNNSFFNNSTGGGFAAVDLIAQTGAIGTVTVRNNLAHAPNASSPPMISTVGIVALVQSNNSSNGQVDLTSPNWANATPSLPAHFRLNAGSYAINGDADGSFVPVFSDFFRVSRPQGGLNDMGAAERR